MAVIIETILDIFELDGIPGFNEDDEKSPPDKVVELKRRIRAADAILFVTPEYTLLGMMAAAECSYPPATAIGAIAACCG
jgi:hypothetical protein